MPNLGPAVETMKLTDAKQQFSRVVDRVLRTRNRVLVEKGGIPVAAIVSTEDLERLKELDAEWEQDVAVFDEIGAAFSDVDPEEIEREASAALAEVRADMQAEREAAART